MKISIHNYSKCTGLTRRDHPNTSVLSAWGSHSLTWSGFEGHLFNCLVLLHIKVSSSLISEKQLWKPISITWNIVLFKKIRIASRGGAYRAEWWRDTFPLLCCSLWLHLSQYTERFWETDLAISLQTLTFCTFSTVSDTCHYMILPNKC